jgi:hypothetical protein
VGWIKRHKRMKAALYQIGTDCTNYHPYKDGSMTCRQSDRTMDSEFGASRWCDACIASYGLGLPELDPNTSRSAYLHSKFPAVSYGEAARIFDGP